MPQPSEPISRLPGKPIATFQQDGHAAILNYNLPARTTFVVRRYIPLGMPDDAWKPHAKSKPASNPYEYVKDDGKKKAEPATGGGQPRKPGMSIPDFREKLVKKKKDFDPGPDPVDEDDFRAAMALDYLAAHHPAFAFMRGDTSLPGGPGLAPGLARKGLQLAVSAITAGVVAEPDAFDLKQAVEQAKNGNLPVLKRSMWGRPRYSYVGEPDGPEPRLYLIEEYEVASYLGDYGAGRTVNTFSLLAGESTTISIRTWRKDTATQAKSENVLDSYSEQSADELESIINDEAAMSSSQQDAASVGFQSTETWSQSGVLNMHTDVKGGVNLGIVNFGGGASTSASGTIGHSDTDVNTSSLNSTRANTASAIHKGMDRHVSQSSAARKVEVNAETSSTATTETGEEKTITRTLRNINLSRVLNFVFRQMTQEFLTITFLKNVRVGYTNGYPGEEVMVDLDNVGGLFGKVLKKEHVSAARHALIDELSSVRDFQGKHHKFIEEVKETLPGPKGKNTTRSYLKKSTDYQKDVDQAMAAKLGRSVAGKTVDGIILDVARRIINTDAVVVEALLGQGEALDFYNIQLQDAGIRKAHLANEQQKAALEALAAITDPMERSEAYAAMFNAPPPAVPAED